VVQSFDQSTSLQKQAKSKLELHIFIPISRHQRDAAYTTVMNLSDESWPTDVPSNHYVLLIVIETKSSKSNNTAGAGTNIVDAAATTAATGDARQAPVYLQPAEREVVVIVRVLARRTRSSRNAVAPTCDAGSGGTVHAAICPFACSDASPWC
jgi:hypothetical protein